MSPRRSNVSHVVATTIFTLTLLYSASSQPQSYLVCKTHNSPVCLVWNLQANDVGNFERIYKMLETVDLCKLSSAIMLTSHRTSVSGNPSDQDYFKKSLECRHFNNMGTFIGWSIVFKAIDKKVRVRRQTNFAPRGRYRGQTQSQYLAIDNGNKNDEGKAEAHSAADSSRASVSGNSGMGQAQSQSIYDPSCDDCYGKSEYEANNLKREPYSPVDQHAGNEKTTPTHWPGGVRGDGGLIPSSGSNGSGGPFQGGIHSGIPGQKYGDSQGPGSYGPGGISGTDTFHPNGYGPGNKGLPNNYGPGGNQQGPDYFQRAPSSGQHTNEGFGPNLQGSNVGGSDRYKPGTNVYRPGIDMSRPGSDSYGPGSNGYRPGSDGYRPGSDGYRPGSDGYRPGSDGYRPGSDGYRPGSDGYRPGSKGYGPGNKGYGPGSDGYRPGSDGYRPGTDGYRSGTDGYRPRTDGYRSGTDGYRPGSDGYMPGSEGYRPGTDGYGPGGDGYRPGGVGFRPGSDNFRPGSNPYIPGLGGNQDLKPDGRGSVVPGQNNVNPNYNTGQHGEVRPGTGQTLDGSTNFIPSQGRDSNSHRPDQTYQPGNQGYGPGSLTPSQGNMGYSPDQKNFGPDYSGINNGPSGRGPISPGTASENGNAAPSPGGITYRPGETALIPHDQLGTGPNNVPQQENIPGLGEGVPNLNTQGPSGSRWPLATGPYPGVGGTNVYCCAIPNNGQNINTSPNTYGQIGQNVGISPSTTGNSEVPNNLLSPGQYNTDTQKYPGSYNGIPAGTAGTQPGIDDRYRSPPSNGPIGSEGPYYPGGSGVYGTGVKPNANFPQYESEHPGPFYKPGESGGQYNPSGFPSSQIGNNNQKLPGGQFNVPISEGPFRSGSIGGPQGVGGQKSTGPTGLGTYGRGTLDGPSRQGSGEQYGGPNIQSSQRSPGPGGLYSPSIIGGQDGRGPYGSNTLGGTYGMGSWGGPNIQGTGQGTQNVQGTPIYTDGLYGPSSGIQGVHQGVTPDQGIPSSPDTRVGPGPNRSYGPGITGGPTGTSGQYGPYGTGTQGPNGLQYGEPNRNGGQYGPSGTDQIGTPFMNHNVGGSESGPSGPYPSRGGTNAPGRPGSTFNEHNNYMPGVGNLNEPTGLLDTGTNIGPPTGPRTGAGVPKGSGPYGTDTMIPPEGGQNQGNYGGTPGTNGYYPGSPIGGPSGSGGQQSSYPGHYQPNAGNGGPYGYNNQGSIGPNKETDMPQNFVDPALSSSDDDDSEAEASVSQASNGTTASASSKGGNSKERAQANVHGTYTGSGSFQAQAQISGDNKGAESEVSGGRKGASSSASGNGRNNKSQANVQLGSETGSVQTQSQSNGIMHSSNSQVQGSVKGGMADAQARGPGSTSSQAQIGFTPYKDIDKTSHDRQATPFIGGGLASAQSSGRTGQSQSQLHGTFKYGITYNGAAQSGASLDKDAVFPNRLSFDKIDVFDEKDKLINTTDITDEPLPLSTENIPEESSTVEVPYHTRNENENINDETMKNSESRYSSHTHLDHHKSDVTSEPTVLNSKSFQTNYSTNGMDYDMFNPDKDQPEDYETDAGFNPDGNEAGIEPGEYSNYDEYTKNTQTHESLQTPRHNGVEIKQTTGGNTQHILLDSLKNQDAEITQKNSERPDESKIYQPGERVPGTGGYTIPLGFTGSVKSVASKDKTYVVGSKNSPSQAQTVTLTPGTGRINYKQPNYYGKYVKPKDLRNLNSDNDNDDRYMSVSKSVTRALDSENNIKKQYSHTYYTKSSSCGYFTFTCTMVSNAEGRKKVCKPKMPTNPDGTPIRC